MAATNSSNFGEMLSQAIHVIKACQGKTVAIVQDEIGYALGRSGGAAVERWRQGPLPPAVSDREKLARLIIEHSCGRLDREWLQEFLISADHPYPEKICDDLFPPPLPEFPSPDSIPLKPQETRSIFQAPPDIRNFVGRHDLLEKIKSRLLTAGQICVLQGMGGAGKTALATHLAYELRSYFPDGVLWGQLDNAILEDGSLNANRITALLSAFTQAYGRDVSAEMDLLGRSQVMREVLANKRALLILDNAHGTEDVRHLLPPSPGPCSVLITTRNRKMLLDRATSFAIETLPESESLALLSNIVGEQRVIEELPGARRLIHFLGGLPLAIKIVASDLAETKYLTLQEYGDLLRDERTRLAHLADWEDASKDVRASFELSYRRLSQPLQRLFSLLGVFAGNTFSIEAVAAVAQIPLPLAKKHVGHLQSLSLVETNSAEGAQLVASTHLHHGQLERYRLHPLLRLFAREKLGDAIPELMQRAVGYFTTFTYENRQQQYHLIDLDWENIWGALQWAMQNQAGEILLRAVDGLTAVRLGVVGFLDARGYWQEATGLLEKAIVTPVAADELLSRATIFFKLGAFAFRQAATDTAEQYFRQSLSLLEELPDSEDVILVRAAVCGFMSQLMMERDIQAALEWLQRGQAALQDLESGAARHEEGYLSIRHATILGMTGKLDEAMAAAGKGIALLPGEPTPARVSGCMTLGNLHFFLGDSEQAIASWNEGAREAQVLGDNRRLAGLWQNIAAEQSFKGRFAQAAATCEKALKLFRQIGDVAGEGNVRSNVAVDYMLLGEDEAALKHLQSALDLAKIHQLPRLKAFALVNYARLQLYRDDVTTAPADLARAWDICCQLDLAQLQAEILRYQAELALRDGQYSEAQQLIEESLQAAVDQSEAGISWRVKGNILHILGDSPKARVAYKTSLDLLADQDPFELAKTQLALARLHLENQDKERGKRLLTSALATFEKLQTKREIAAAKALIAQQIQ